MIILGGSGSGTEGENGGGTSQPEGKTYKISGIVWLDENQNGKYDVEEKVQKDITVYLINESGQTLQTTKTKENGEYTFSGLNKGKYIVSFTYNSSEYGLTFYKKEGIDENVNSNVIGDNGTAITDTIEITDISIGNINMGLIAKEIFDLKLEKFVSKIVVQTENGSKTYNQKDKTTLAKADIRAKELKGAKVIMEYEIVVTNEGKQAGYAEKIVDYMPKDTEFSSELNNNWYLGSDGALHTTELKDIVINPGESKTVKVVLIRNMTNDNTDTVNNRAEIAKSESISQTADKDSIAGNKVSSEDDIGSADIIIGVATGSEVIYTTLGIICMIILAIGMYFIKKNILNK